jgi:hypothetical protein
MQNVFGELNGREVDMKEAYKKLYSLNNEYSNSYRKILNIKSVVLQIAIDLLKNNTTYNPENDPVTESDTDYSIGTIEDKTHKILENDNIKKRYSPSIQNVDVFETEKLKAPI